MNLSQRVAAFVKLGDSIQEMDHEIKEELFWRAQNENNWFTEESISSALDGLAYMVQEKNLNKWLSFYDIPQKSNVKSIGILMAGNIPLVGFHDFLTVLISGNKACIKLSSSDSILMNWVFKKLVEIEPLFEPFIEVEEMLKGKDAYIATGSDNSSRYFNYYFGKYPSVIRQNRTSVAILSGNENVEDLVSLGLDIFKYFGLGCRNVSKVYIKTEVQLQDLLGALEIYSFVGNHHKYRNNYDYNKSIYLVNSEKHLDNGFLLVKESSDLVSPISVLYYEKYDSKEELKNKLESQKNKIQCIVSDTNYWTDAISFGNAQNPEPWEYADQVDTLKFLIELN
ncbi:acyl-CoA reductase [Algoriphagus sp.]|uniref:acyl-CoA reductase n=1 Tax=Algoriphagus sp. TaxID=1872435 RepID=UPI0025D7169D|nr:acyl-CoA reductase [Algoriphagus sp.]